MTGVRFREHYVATHSPVKSSYAEVPQAMCCQAEQLALGPAGRTFLCSVIDLVEPSQRDVIAEYLPYVVQVKIGLAGAALPLILIKQVALSLINLFSVLLDIP